MIDKQATAVWASKRIQLGAYAVGAIMVIAGLPVLGGVFFLMGTMTAAIGLYIEEGD